MSDDRSMYGPGQGQRPLPPGSGYGNQGGRHNLKCPSLNVSARVDPRTLAALCEAFIKAGYYPRSISTLIHDALDEFLDALVRSGAAERIQTYNEAISVLYGRGLYTKQLNKAGRNTKGLGSVIHAASVEDMQLDRMQQDIRVNPEGIRVSAMEYNAFAREVERIAEEVKMREEAHRQELLGRVHNVPPLSKRSAEIIAEKDKRSDEGEEGESEAFLEAKRRALEAGVPPPVSDPD